MANWYQNVNRGGGTRLDYMRVYVIESPNPLDVLAGRAEGPIVASIARLVGHEAMEMQARSEAEFAQLCSYIGSTDCVVDDDPGRTACLHISAHGNDDGLQIGGDDVGWEELAEHLQPFLRKPNDGDVSRIVVLSACSAARRKMAKAIAKYARPNSEAIAPRYLFCPAGEPDWDAAAVAWAVFYHFLPHVDFDDKKSVQGVLEKIASIGLPRFVYFRWDDAGNSYLKWTAPED